LVLRGNRDLKVLRHAPDENIVSRWTSLASHSSCETEAAVKSVQRQTIEKGSKNAKCFHAFLTRFFEATMTMDDLVDRLKKLPPSKHHVHETEACQMLKIRAANGGNSARDKLSESMSTLRQGHAGTMMIDLFAQGVPNDFNIHLMEHGKREAFATDRLDRLAAAGKVNRAPRWFSFGLHCMDIKKQLQIMKSVTGEAPTMDKATAERRKATWLAWHDNVPEQEFKRRHLPTIA
jgi:hypothetical protein